MMIKFIRKPVYTKIPTKIAKKMFDELNCQPFRVISVNTSTYYLYDNIKAVDLLKVAARRPKITRAILLKREQS